MLLLQHFEAVVPQRVQNDAPSSSIGSSNAPEIHLDSDGCIALDSDDWYSCSSASAYHYSSADWFFFFVRYAQTFGVQVAHHSDMSPSVPQANLRILSTTEDPARSTTNDLQSTQYKFFPMVSQSRSGKECNAHPDWDWNSVIVCFAFNVRQTAMILICFRLYLCPCR